MTVQNQRRAPQTWREISHTNLALRAWARQKPDPLPKVALVFRLPPVPSEILSLTSQKGEIVVQQTLPKTIISSRDVCGPLRGNETSTLATKSNCIVDLRDSPPPVNRMPSTNAHLAPSSWRATTSTSIQSPPPHLQRVDRGSTAIYASFTLHS